MASITEENGKFRVRVYFYDKDGKRHAKSKSNFETYKEADKWATKIKQRVYDAQITIDSNTPFPAYFWDWFETYKESSVTERTKQTYKQVHNVLKEYFELIPIDKITRRDYQRFLKAYGIKHAKSTVSKNNSLIHACVKDAIYDGVIVKDFVGNTSIVYDKKKTRKIEYLNMTELDALTIHLKKTLNPNFTSKYMILLAIYTGMRLGEIQGLKWEDINFDFKTVSIKRTWNETEFSFQPTKNESSVRIIRVNKEVLELLNQIKRHTNRSQVFTNQYNKVPTSSAVNKTLKQALKDAGIDRKGFHFHSLRHTHVAYLLAKQIDLYVISKRLGHSDIGTTTRVYSYLIDEYKTKTDNQIENALNQIGLNNTPKTVQEVY